MVGETGQCLMVLGCLVVLDAMALGLMVLALVVLS